MNLRTKNNKLLIKNGKLGTTNNCCCNTCSGYVTLTIENSTGHWQDFETGINIPWGTGYRTDCSKPYFGRYHLRLDNNRIVDIYINYPNTPFIRVILTEISGNTITYDYKLNSEKVQATRLDTTIDSIPAYTNLNGGYAWRNRNDYVLQLFANNGSQDSYSILELHLIMPSNNCMAPFSCSPYDVIRNLEINIPTLTTSLGYTELNTFTNNAFTTITGNYTPRLIINNQNNFPSFNQYLVPFDHPTNYTYKTSSFYIEHTHPDLTTEFVPQYSIGLDLHTYFYGHSAPEDLLLKFGLFYEFYEYQSVFLPGLGGYRARKKYSVNTAFVKAVLSTEGSAELICANNQLPSCYGWSNIDTAGWNIPQYIRNVDDLKFIQSYDLYTHRCSNADGDIQCLPDNTYNLSVVDNYYYITPYLSSYMLDYDEFGSPLLPTYLTDLSGNATLTLSTPDQS